MPNQYCPECDSPLKAHRNILVCSVCLFTEDSNGNSPALPLLTRLINRVKEAF